MKKAISFIFVLVVMFSFLASANLNAAVNRPVSSETISGVPATSFQNSRTGVVPFDVKFDGRDGSDSKTRKQEFTCEVPEVMKIGDQFTCSIDLYQTHTLAFGQESSTPWSYGVQVPKEDAFKLVSGNIKATKYVYRGDSNDTLGSGVVDNGNERILNPTTGLAPVDFTKTTGQPYSLDADANVTEKQDGRDKGNQYVVWETDDMYMIRPTRDNSIKQILQYNFTFELTTGDISDHSIVSYSSFAVNWTAHNKDHYNGIGYQNEYVKASEATNTDMLVRYNTVNSTDNIEGEPIDYLGYRTADEDPFPELDVNPAEHKVLKYYPSIMMYPVELTGKDFYDVGKGQNPVGVSFPLDFVNLVLDDETSMVLEGDEEVLVDPTNPTFKTSYTINLKKDFRRINLLTLEKTIDNWVYETATRSGASADSIKITDTTDADVYEDGYLAYGEEVTFDITGKFSGKIPTGKIATSDVEGSADDILGGATKSNKLLVTYYTNTDEDGDGVIDGKDQCPDTPEGASVDADGCSDEDGDGVPDGKDLCPNTPEGASVDADGCSDVDTDGDGVVDGKDLCPNDKGSAATQGCPDTDGDGVADFTYDRNGKKVYSDLCPLVAGTKANNGCPDADGDGFPDTMDINGKIDECPTLAAPESKNGCPDGVIAETGSNYGILPLITVVSVLGVVFVFVNKKQI